MDKVGNFVHQDLVKDQVWEFKDLLYGLSHFAIWIKRGHDTVLGFYGVRFVLAKELDFFVFL